MIAHKNNRRYRRIPYVLPVRISWEDQGEQCFSPARCIDLSEDGMRVEVSQRVRPGTRILVSAERIQISGAASVRRMDQFGGKYLLGLQLAQAVPSKKIAQLEGGPFA